MLHRVGPNVVVPRISEPIALLARTASACRWFSSRQERTGPSQPARPYGFGTLGRPSIQPKRPVRANFRLLRLVLLPRAQKPLGGGLKPKRARFAVGNFPRVADNDAAAELASSAGCGHCGAKRGLHPCFCFCFDQPIG